MIKLTEIAWLAGLLEGEGYFHLNRERYPRVVLSMTDEDVVTKAAILMKSRVHRNGNVYTTSISGVKAIGWVMTLYSYLHKRRKERIRKIIKVWKNNHYKAPPGMKTMAKCHPDRVVQGYELCKSCYGKEYHRKRKLTSV